jgi:hypothetical protein
MSDRLALANAIDNAGIPARQGPAGRAIHDYFATKAVAEHRAMR